MASQTQTVGFEKWVDSFMRSRAGKLALADLDKLAKYGEARDFRKFHAAVLQTCYHAHQFDSAPWMALFQRQRDYFKLARAQKKHVNALRDFIKLYPQESRHALLGSITALDGTDLEVNGHVCYPWLKIAIAADNLLTAYADKLPQIGPYPAPNVKLPLFYPSQLYLQKRSRDVRLDSLIFTLAIRFRDWTHLATVRILDTGTEMPLYGKPCHQQIELFVNATLNKKPKDNYVKDSLRNIPAGTKLGTL